MPLELWTIGHSTRSFVDFLKLLHARQIRTLVDVRRYPASRRHPQFNAAALAEALAGSDIDYHAIAGLGGRRKAQPDSVNLGWRNESFRGYADYMQTEPFAHALEALLPLASGTRTVIMCAEAVPWRCHRSLIADAIVTQGWRVHHILTRDGTDTHTRCPFAKSEGGRLIYPNFGTPSEPRLF